MKKIFPALLAILLSFSLLAGCSDNGTENKKPDDSSGGNETEITPPKDEGPSEAVKTNLSADGYVKGKIGDFSQYENTAAYRKVKTAEELAAAIADAKCHYKSSWDNEANTFVQVPEEGYTAETLKGTVRVIEIENDINMGYYTLSEQAKSYGIIDDYAKNANKWKDYLTMSDMFTGNGISQIKVENTSDLMIYSKNGATLTHCGFKLTSDNNVVFRNLKFDELWQWEDAPVKDTSKIGDYDWFGWAYFKIAFCGYIWIDHCTFGKSYDGQIDYSNPVYTTEGTAFRAPYGADGNNGLHISWCRFNAGSDDKDGYIYKMMEKAENDYKNGGSNYLYYNALRDAGASFEDILYGVAIPQKKGFLCGDDAKFSGSYDNEDDYNFNLKLQVSFSNCYFKNLEDRLPKLRGGNAAMYNCVVDSTEYYGYRTKLRSLNVASAVSNSKLNNSWKCGLVSQCIVCGNGGSVYAENCVYRGIDSFLKNNDSKNSAPYVYGGYKIVNCSYDKTGTGTPYIGSSEANHKFPNSTTSLLKTDYFKWHTENEEQPFTVAAIALDELEGELNNKDYGAGVGPALKVTLLKNVY